MDPAASATPFPFQCVLYATDFSEYSENAGRYASLLARQFGAELVVTHAFMLSQAAMELEAEMQRPQKSQQRLDLEAALAEMAERIGKGVERVTPLLLEGDAREQIPALARQKAPALIVMGSSGRGRVERGLVGSVAERILRAANGPSLTVGPHVAPLGANPAPFRHILYATSLSPEAAQGAACAAGMATAFHACMDVLHVVPKETGDNPEQLSAAQQRIAALIEEIVPEQAKALCSPKGIVEAGTAHTRILEHIEEHSVDLLVLSLHKSSHLWLESRLSGAFHIIANAPCPVLTIVG